MKKKLFYNSGFALIYAVFYVFLILITITALTLLTINNLRETKRGRSAVSAYQVAMAGIEDGMHQQKQKGPLSSYRFYLKSSTTDDISSSPNPDFVGEGYYELSFSSPASQNSTITAVGYSPWQQTYLQVMLQAVPNPGNCPPKCGYTIKQIGDLQNQ